MRGLLFRSKKKLLSAFGFYFFGKSIQKRPDSVCEDDVNNEKMFARIICQTIEWDVNYSTAKRKIYIYYFGFYFLVRVSKTSYSSVIVVPFESAGIRAVENRLNQDTTVYYGLVFWAFSWPYMAKDIIVE